MLSLQFRYTRIVFIFFHKRTGSVAICTLSLHVALPICQRARRLRPAQLHSPQRAAARRRDARPAARDGRPRARTGLTPHPRMERSEEHTSELQSRENLVCRLLLEKKKCTRKHHYLFFHL